MTNWSFDAEIRAGRLVVGQGVTIATVEPVREALLQGFAAADRIVLDLGGSGEIDVAGLQLFHAAHRFAGERGKVLQLVNVGERLCELARAAGFAHGETGNADKNTPDAWANMA